MAKVVRLDTREQRKPLAPRDAPYYVDVAKGIAIGYRKGTNGATWSLRTFNGTRYHKRQVGAADDSSPADGVTMFAWKDVVRIAMAEPAKADAFNAKYSVREAVDDYFNHRRSRARSIESVTLDAGKVKKFVDEFGDNQVTQLTTVRLQRWLDGLVAVPQANAQTPDSERRALIRASQNTANRVWTPCCAALNFAFRQGRVASNVAWKRIKKFEDVDEARTRFLSVRECKKLLRVTKGAFAELVRAALLTGMRPGELVRLQVSEFSGSSLKVSAGKTGKRRFVPLTTEGQTFFRTLVKKRAGPGFMLPNAQGLAWTRMQIARAMRDASSAAKLKPPAVFYDLRRSYGSLLANAGTGDEIIANALGHSDTRMTRRHYAHLLDSVVAAELQAKLPSFKSRQS